ncbi:MAG: flagellar protein FliS [Pirellulales bacterium]|nr:flagellar protein FliS [Pirellulales bacterium]
MNGPTNNQYLESKVLTAPPQRLHLMLIDGAIRFGRQAEEHLKRGERVAAATPLLRVVDILGELLASVRENKGTLNEQIAELYLFLFRRVSEAKVNEDLATLGEVLQLLEYERQTWQMICEKLGTEAPNAAPIPARSATPFYASNTPKKGVSFEA